MARSDNDSAPRYAEDEMKARASWHYYVEGLTQEQIADVLGVGRIKVHRILSAAREEGIVQFRIRDSVFECMRLEKQLKERYRLKDATVVPSPSDRQRLRC